MSVTIWFTGLPASGKTTLAASLHKTITERGFRCELFDSDRFVSQWLYDGPSSERNRALNDRIMALVSKYLNHHGIICLVTSTMAPPGRRKEIRQILPDYIEIFCKCSLATSTQRDPKGLYLLSTLGNVTNFPNNMAEYETPVSADLVVDTETSSKQVCLGEILRFLSSKKILTDHK